MRPIKLCTLNQELSALILKHISFYLSLQVAVFSSSQSKTDTANDIGDPSMIIMPAEGQYSADYTFSTPTYRKPPGADTDQYTIYVLVSLCIAYV